MSKNLNVPSDAGRWRHWRKPASRRTASSQEPLVEKGQSPHTSTAPVGLVPEPASANCTMAGASSKASSWDLELTAGAGTGRRLLVQRPPQGRRPELFFPSGTPLRLPAGFLA
ncbi:hypothetical protein HPB50_014919 [Hyalomma asiaticum]|uniref:Uncharacterized protein n=1 Tax=Hyalomma asiaticum TaxID=266040 RepID=A0ACB7RWE7_HYAAI|nr:hypothetical protein HPB50_014919 [Hyalomma asiaticum]